MKFDRTAPGGGVDVICRLENAKLYLEWNFYVIQEEESSTSEEPEEIQGIIRICLTDRNGNVVMECLKALQEEEPIKGILLQPHLWRGAKEPYLYEMEAVLTDRNGRCIDRFRRQLPLRDLRNRDIGSGMEMLLNGVPFVSKAVCYSLPDAGVEAQRQMLEDMQQIIQLGANCVCMKKEEPAKFFWQFCELCDRYGILVFVGEKQGRQEGEGRQKRQEKQGRVEGQERKEREEENERKEEERQGKDERREREERQEGERRQKREEGDERDWVCSWDRKVRMACSEKVPDYCGVKNGLFLQGSRYPTSLYYKYKAKWTEKPFIYLAPESVKKLKSGNYSVCCYSNCSRVALYADGILFEFQKGKGEFIFREIPAKSPCVMLTAEGEGCSTSLSVHKLLLPSCY